MDDGIDPAIAKQDAKREKQLNAVNTFETIVREWHQHKQSEWTEKHAHTIMTRLEANLFPKIGGIAIKEIMPPILLEMFREIETRGVY